MSKDVIAKAKPIYYVSGGQHSPETGPPEMLMELAYRLVADDSALYQEQRPDGLVRSTLKKAYRDGTVAVDIDPLSLLCRLATSVPLPRFHTIHYAGVLAAASPWRSRLKPSLPPTAKDVEPENRVRKSGYRPWAELLQRTFSIDVLTCPSCQGRMRLLAVVKNPAGMARGQAFASLKGGFALARCLAAAGELTEVPGRSPVVDRVAGAQQAHYPEIGAS